MASMRNRTETVIRGLNDCDFVSKKKILHKTHPAVCFFSAPATLCQLWGFGSFRFKGTRIRWPHGKRERARALRSKTREFIKR